MKKIFAVFITIALVISTVAGCSSVAANTVFSADDLVGKTIGVQLGTTGDIYASDYEEEGSIIERYNKGTDAVQALKQGKVDCVIIDNEPAKVFVSKNSDLKILDEPFAEEDYAICLKQGNDDLKEKINGAIATLKSNGTLKNIIDNYIGNNAGKTPYTSPAGVVRSNGTLTMATNAEFPPYEFKESDKIVGIDADMAQAVCDILGMDLKIEDMAFDSIITSVQSGKANVGIAGMTVTEKRLQSVDFTDSYTTATQVIIVRAK
ncbi:MAG: transporter substrate-binding domain-containing protein [Oscillospiraceae bacterium]|nr:transporter substrate-binding domain-containing protein [Oscillospiraceae bacterium]